MRPVVKVELLDELGAHAISASPRRISWLGLCVFELSSWLRLELIFGLGLCAFELISRRPLACVVFVSLLQGGLYTDADWCLQSVPVPVPFAPLLG